MSRGAGHAGDFTMLAKSVYAGESPAVLVNVRLVGDSLIALVKVDYAGESRQR